MFKRSVLGRKIFIFFISLWWAAMLSTLRTIGLVQGWATLFDSRATLVTKLVDEGQYKQNKYLFDMTFEKMCFQKSIFSKEASLFLMLYQLKKNVRGPHLGTWRAACGPRAGRCPGLVQSVAKTAHDRKVVGLNPVTVILDRSGVKATQV